MVLAAPPQTQNAHPVIGHDVVVDAVAALRGNLIVVGIVVPVDVQQRTPGHGDKKAQIPCAQVAAGEDEVDALQPPADAGRYDF